MSHTNNWETNGLYRKFSGILCGDEILNSNFELHTDPRFQDIKYIINDFLDVTEFSIKTTHTSAYAKSDEIISNAKIKLRIAILVTNPELIDLANDYRNKMKDCSFDCEIFQTIEEARKWAYNY